MAFRRRLALPFSPASQVPPTAFTRNGRTVATFAATALTMAKTSIAATGTRSKRKAPTQTVDATATTANTPATISTAISTSAMASVISPAPKKRRTTPRKQPNPVPFPSLSSKKNQKQKQTAAAEQDVINLYEEEEEDDAEGDGFYFMGIGGVRKKMLFFDGRDLGDETKKPMTNNDAEDDETEFEVLGSVRQATPDIHLPAEYIGRMRVVQQRGDVYDAMLTRACVHQNQNEFVLLQVLECDGSEYFMWSRWGLVGNDGESELQGPWATADEAIGIFLSVFLTKTVRHWDERHALQFGDGGFTYIETHQSLANEEDTAAAIEAAAEQATPTRKRRASSKKKSRMRASPRKPSKPKPLQEITVSKTALPAGTAAPRSRLDQEVQHFLTIITEAASNPFSDPRFYATKPVLQKKKRAKHTANDLNTVDSDDVVYVPIPLGKLSKSTIVRGFEALHRLHDALQVHADRTTLTQLSSRFYSVVPHTQLSVIESMARLVDKVEMLVALAVHCKYEEVLLVQKPCLTTRYFSINQLDVAYHDLDCRLFPLLPTSREFGLVQSYIFNSFCCMGNNYGADGKLVTVFRVEKPQDAERFKEFRSASNRRVLWHGSRMSNWRGILTHGLLITPPGVPLNGSSLGAGLYFTDKISKASAYSHASHDHQVFLLSEVALGTCKPSQQAAAMRNTKKAATATAHHSCHGVGRCVPDSNGNFTDAFGAVWPLGKPTPTKDATATHGHSEFVVYNTAQARMRYIVVTRPLY